MKILRKIKQFSPVLGILFLFSCSAPVKKEAVTEDRMQWWKDAKFGMFIHWGVIQSLQVLIKTSRSPVSENGS